MALKKSRYLGRGRPEGYIILIVFEYAEREELISREQFYLYKLKPCWPLRNGPPLFTLQG